MKIKIDEIKIDPNNPRKVINEESLKHLAQSMSIEGLIHPIEVDTNYMIIVGEMRYRAAKSLGWTEIEASINNTNLGEYERLRRQMAENLQQSGSKGGGSPMNDIDTARAWEKLLKLKGWKKVSGGTPQIQSHSYYGKYVEDLAKDVGVSTDIIYDRLNLLKQPKAVIDDIKERNRPMTYYIEAERAPEEIKPMIHRKIQEGHYHAAEDLRTDISLIKKNPELRTEILNKKSTSINPILTTANRLEFLFKDIPFASIEYEDDKKMLIRQLSSLHHLIEEYLGINHE